MGEAPNTKAQLKLITNALMRTLSVEADPADPDQLQIGRLIGRKPGEATLRLTSTTPQGALLFTLAVPPGGWLPRMTRLGKDVRQAMHLLGFDDFYGDLPPNILFTGSPNAYGILSKLTESERQSREKLGFFDMAVDLNALLKRLQLTEQERDVQTEQQAGAEFTTKSGTAWQDTLEVLDRARAKAREGRSGGRTI